MHLKQARRIEGVSKRQFRNILIVRTDRIGDVILTLPMIAATRSNVPSARISMLLRSYTKSVAEGQTELTSILLYDRNGVAKSFWTMLGELRAEHFDVAFVVFPRFRIALLMMLAGIKVRVGSGYRWYSFLFTNRVFEHRKTAEKHESQYNLSLLRAVGFDIPDHVSPRVVVDARNRASASRIRGEVGIRKKERLVVLHPGSGGSARNWSPENFSRLAARLRAKRIRVVVTGSEEERMLVQHVVERAGADVIPLAGMMTLGELGAFIQAADLFVANSTGPLHLAAGVGTPVIGFYPPILVASPQRWGPLTGRKEIFVPDRNRCPLCKGGECESNVCMDQIEFSRVFDAAMKLLKKPVKRKAPGNG